MKKILIVDDDNILRKILKESLEQQGYQVRDARLAKEGLKIFSNYRPDLIVADITMPEMDGFTFCRQLREQPSGELVPFIFLSARDELEDRIQGHKIGADDYITKPFKMAELLAKIQGRLERSTRIHAEIVRLLQSDRNDSSGEKNLSTSVDKENNLARKNWLKITLTPAEEKVFWEAIKGLTNKQISEHLFISPRTVQTHLSNILHKFNLENRTQLVRFAYEKGYSPEPEPIVNIDK